MGRPRRRATKLDWFDFLGLRAPKWVDIKLESRTKSKPSPLPLHVKDVGAGLNIAKLEELEVSDQQLKDDLSAVIRWLDDPSLYKELKWDRRYPKANITRQQRDLMIEYIKCKVVTRDELAKRPTRGVCRVFTVDEEEQNRCRPIGHPTTNNDAVSPLIDLKLDTKEQLHAPLKKKHQYSVALDMLAWFDQLPLTEDVRANYRFKFKEEVHEFLKSTMGSVQSPEVGHTITRVLADGTEITGAKSTVWMDNVRWVGDRHAVIESAKMFIRRCKAVGAIVKETMDEDAIEGMVVQEGDFLGETYDYANGAVRVAQKTLKKIDYLWARRTLWNRKQLAAMYSLLFYSSTTLGISPVHYFDAMRFLRSFSAEMVDHPDDWVKPAPGLPAGVWKQLADWKRTVDRNEWSVIEEVPRPTKWIVTDASGWGYGSICWNGHSVQFDSHPWDARFVEAASQDFSAHAEPEAVLRSVRRWVVPGEAAMIYTDHQAFEFAYRRTYSKSYIVNEILRKLEWEFRGLLFVQYLRGSLNPADGISRGASLMPEKDQANFDEWLAKVREFAVAGDRSGQTEKVYVSPGRPIREG